jgi:hypothetical protein
MEFRIKKIIILINILPLLALVYFLDKDNIDIISFVGILYIFYFLIIIIDLPLRVIRIDNNLITHKTLYRTKHILKEDVINIDVNSDIIYIITAKDKLKISPIYRDFKRIKELLKKNY